MPGAIGSDVAIAFNAAGRSLRRRPRDEAAVARALHADPAVAPRLLRNPLDDGARIVAVGLERCARPKLRIPRDARKREHADVAVGRGLSRIPARSIERELEQRRQCAGAGNAPRTDQRRRDRRILRSGDRDLFDDVAPFFVFCEERSYEAAETAIGVEREPGLHELECFIERDGALPASLVERALEGFPQRLDRFHELVFQLVGAEIVETIQRIPECFGICARERHALCRFDRPRLRVDVVDHGAGRRGPLLALPPLLQRQTRGVRRSRFAGHHLQRCEIRQVAIGNNVFVDGHDALGEIAQGGRQSGVSGIRGGLESEILRGRERRQHGDRDQEQDFRRQGFHGAEGRTRSVTTSSLSPASLWSLVRCSTRANSGRCDCVVRPM